MFDPVQLEQIRQVLDSLEKHFVSTEGVAFERELVELLQLVQVLREGLHGIVQEGVLLVPDLGRVLFLGDFGGLAWRYSCPWFPYL